MLIVIDVGNTNSVIGVFDDAASHDVACHWRASSDPRRTADEWALLLRQFLASEGRHVADVHGVVIGSVVAKVTVALRRACARLGVVPLIVDWRTDTGIVLRLDDPSSAGADRLANAVAARAVVEGAVVVVDLGTATTFDVVSADGAYLGGVILPGIEISLDALFDRASGLRRIDLSPPTSVVGSSTAAALQSGATHGFSAQIDGVCDRVRSEIGPCTFIATGGLSAVVASLSERIDRHDPWLTLQGLRLIYLRGQSEASET